MKMFWKDNPEAQQRIDEAIDLTAKAAEKHIGNNIRSIMLVGSFSRGEGIWKEKNGDVDILSDLDILLISKTLRKVPNNLINEINQIGNRLKVNIDLKIKSLLKVKLYPKDTHSFDLCQTAKVIYGKNLLNTLPKVSQKDLDKGAIEAIFFNRTMLNISKCSPDDLYSSSRDALLSLSYAAAKTMFTCADIITIYNHCYSSFISERIKLMNGKLRAFVVNKENFLGDLNAAYKFTFEHTDKIAIEQTYEYWLRTRQHLIDTFLFAMDKENEAEGILYYETWSNSYLPFFDKICFFYKKLKISYILLKKYNFLKLFWNFQPIVYFRMVSLMLYLAIDKDKEKIYTSKAMEYFSKIGTSAIKKTQVKDLWISLTNEIIKLNKMGAF